MSVRVRQVTAVAAGIALMGVAACSTNGSAGEDSDSSQDSNSALANLDPCSILTPEQATEAGLPPQGEPEQLISSEPGCVYDGGLDSMMITVYRNAEKTLDEYGSQANWGNFKSIDVNNRPAAEAINESAEDEGLCTTMLSAGGGVVLVDAQSTDPREPFDACGESLKIAKQIEPSLPE